MVETLLGVLIAFAVVFAAGYGALSLLTLGGSLHEVGHWQERLGLVWVIGFGYVSLALFGLGFALSGTPLISGVTVGAIALYAFGHFARRAPSIAPPVNPLTKAEWVLVAIIVVQGMVVLWSVATFPLGWDGLTIWDMKAQIAFSNDGTLPPEYFRDETRSWSHVHYPLYWPYATTWLYMCLGGVDQSWVRVLGAVFYAAAVGILAGAVPRLGGTRVGGMIAAACLFFLPMLTAMPFGVFSGYADFPLGVIFLAAICRLPFWTRESYRVDDRLLALLAMLAVWTKTEGRVLLGALLVSSAVALFCARQWRRILLIAAPAVMLLLIHGAYLRHVQALPDRNYFAPTPGHVVAHIDRLGPILRLMGEQFINWNNWSLLWPGAVLAMATIASLGRRHVALNIAAIIALPLPGYALAYILSTWADYDRHIYTSLSRLLLGLAPAALLAIGLAIPKLTRRGAES